MVNLDLEIPQAGEAVQPLHCMLIIIRYYNFHDSAPEVESA
jgi:hypothetical protein